MRTGIFILTFVLFNFCLYAQDTLNQTDSKGRKQGYWKKKDANGILQYEGKFIDNTPTGEFRYYYPDGKLKAVSRMSDHGHRARTFAYYKSGKKMASGNYLDEKKDSTWQFFSEYDESLLSIQNFKSGLKEGPEKIYLPGGEISETYTWKEGKKEGPWEQYYSDGKLKFKTGYSNDEKQGPFTAYYSNGKIIMTGTYIEGHKDGIWTYFDEKAQVTKKETWTKGILTKTEELQKTQ
jgi:antitoxin component YwqK of YwqJK toxin-antitoxin module